MSRRSFVAAIGAVLVVALVQQGCGHKEPAGAYAPGLGEIMTLNQMRHAKLWWAGQAGNWDLAGYEVDELKEGLHDAATFHPTLQSSAVSPAEIIPVLTAGPLSALRAAIDKKDLGEFTVAFDSLSNACNACHQATGFGFNVVRRPSENTFTNQDFAPRSSR